MPMKFGLIHYNAPGANLEEFLRYAVDTGFDCTELQCRDVWPEGEEHPERRAEEVRALAERLGIAISAFSAGNDFVVLEEDVVAAQVARMKRICDLAEILGTKVIRTEGGQPKESVPEDRWVDAMAGCFRRSWSSPSRGGSASPSITTATSPTPQAFSPHSSRPCPRRVSAQTSIR